MMRLPRNSGVTLLELMFAAGIMTLALSFLFGSLVTIFLASDVVEDRAISVLQISRIMEEVREVSAGDLLSYEPPVVEGLGDNAAAEVRCLSADGAPITLPVDPSTLAAPLPNPTQVQCVLTWTTGRGRILTATVSELQYR